MGGFKSIEKINNLAFSNSIIGRLFIANILLLPLFCGILGVSLDKAFSDSLKSSEKAQLLLQAYALMASAELTNNTLWLPEKLTEDKLNQVSSGLFAMVFSETENKLIWRSPSAINKAISQSWSPIKLSSGQQIFTEVEHNKEQFFFLQYSVTWENSEQQDLTFQFGIFNKQEVFQEQVSIYQQTLWGWLSAISVLIVLIQILILKWGLKPIRTVAEDLLSIQSGKSSHLKGDYPLELTKMTDAINTLLSTEAEQRTRYKDTLSNLAHSLKTPLAIMQGSLYELNNATTQEKSSTSETVAASKNDLTEQINRIDQIINYQLKRSVVAPTNPFFNKVNVLVQCNKIVSTLKKVYREDETQVDIKVPNDVFFNGDEDDLLEVLGNLLDNAFKYGKGQIRIQAKQINNAQISICIEDNGTGISEAFKNKVLLRGERADTTQPGSGIGLASVTDIVSHYGGSCSLEASSLGGLAFKIEF